MATGEAGEPASSALRFVAEANGDEDEMLDILVSGGGRIS